MQTDFQHTQPASLQQLSGNAADEFALHHPVELVALLRKLLDDCVRVHLSTPSGATYITTLWALDAAQRRLSFSADASHPAVQEMAGAGTVCAVAYLDSVKLQFELEHLLLVHGHGASALQCSLPSQLYRFQRREYFRVRTSGSGAPLARLLHPTVPGLALALRVLDVSIGGCALALPAQVPLLPAGARLAGVRIELDADARFDATLSLQHVSSGMGSQVNGARLGCAFVKLEGAAERTLQRYIDQTQKRQRLFTPGCR